VPRRPDDDDHDSLPPAALGPLIEPPLAWWPLAPRCWLRIARVASDSGIAIADGWADVTEMLRVMRPDSYLVYELDGPLAGVAIVYDDGRVWLIRLNAGERRS